MGHRAGEERSLLRHNKRSLTTEYSELCRHRIDVYCYQAFMHLMVFCLQWGKASSLIRFLRAGLILARYEYCGTAVRLLAALSLYPLRLPFWGVVVGGGNACGVDTRSKLDRASGECLGAVCRRKTCQAAIRGRERQARNDLPISEWGNPAGVMTCHSGLPEGARGELKHLSTRRKRKQT